MIEKRTRRAVFSVVAVGALFCGHCAWAAKPDAKNFQYVADAVNHISYLQATSTNAKDNSEEIVATACKMLTQLEKDERFIAIIRKTAPGPMSPDDRKVLTNLGAINDAVEKERQALEDAGFTQLTAIQALAAAIPLAKSIDMGKLNPDGYLSEVAKLRQQACTLTGQIEDSQRWEKKRNALVMGIGGVAIILADGAAEYYSWGLATFVAKFSFAIGGGMMVNATQTLSSL